ncbi:SDR family oxidoreductase [Nocardioides sp.]|uniref:SDR family oxidoreductase n=1 Tax=Nocardioides sp. TaxID=35761 RepID=UPI003511B049
MATSQTPTRRLHGRRVAITGAARGIGLATARACLAEGASVVLGDVDEVAVKEAAAGLGDRALALSLDVTDAASLASFVDEAAAWLGGLDVMINNAGVMPIGPFLDLEDDVEHRSLLINVQGVLTGMRLALRRFTAQGHGHVVNVASTAGLAPIPGGVTYCAEKAAVIHATEAARVEFGSERLHLTCVMPAFTNTDLVAGTSGLKGIANIEPEDVAAGIVEALHSGRKDVFVPRIVGPMLRSQPFLGRRLRDALNTRMGAYDTFLRFDAAARADYAARVKRS